MERLALGEQEASVGRVLDERVLERVGRTGRCTVAQYELRVDELVERRVQLGVSAWTLPR